MTAVGLIALIGVTALALDIGREVLAIQRCQNTADMAALGGAQAIPNTVTAVTYAEGIVGADDAQAGPQNQVVVNPVSDITVYGPGSTNTGAGGNYNNLGPNSYIVKVTGRLYVPFNFASVLGIPGVNVSRTGYAFVGPTSGTSVVPIWMWYQDGNYTPGMIYNVYEDKQGSNIKSFGLAAFAGNGSPMIAHFIQGNNLSPSDIAAATFNIGDTFPVTNGNHGGAWKMGFNDSPNGRLYRASLPPYNTQTPSNYTPDNPRIIIVPLLHGDPTNGTTTIDNFGAFWMISADFTGNHSQMMGQFLNFVTVPNGVPNPQGTGTVNVIKLIH